MSENDEFLRRHAEAAAKTYARLLDAGRRNRERGIQDAIMELDENLLRWTLFDRVVVDLIAERAAPADNETLPEDIDIDEPTLATMRDNDRKLRDLQAEFLNCARRQYAIVSEVPGLEGYARRIASIIEQADPDRI